MIDAEIREMEQHFLTARNQLVWQEIGGKIFSSQTRCLFIESIKSTLLAKFKIHLIADILYFFSEVW